MKRFLMVLIFLGLMIFPATIYAQTSGSTPPPPPVCGSTNAGALYTNTGTSPATVYTCSYYNLAWQWVVNPSYGGLVYYSTPPATCSGALPVFLAGWPNTLEYVCISGVPTKIGQGTFSPLTGDATSTATGGATTVEGLVGVPFCSGFSPTNGQTLQYTTARSPNPCYTAATPGSGTVNSGTTGQIAYYPANGTAVSGETTVPITEGGTGATTAAGANLNITGVTQTGTLGTSSQVSTFSGTVAASNVISANTPFIDPRAYGALCNGTTNDYPAFTAALSVASTLGLPVKVSVPNCYIGSTLTLSGMGTSILGPGGMNTTTPALIFAAGIPGIVLTAQGQRVSDITIKSLDTTATTGDYCIHVTGVAYQSSTARVSCTGFGDKQFYWDSSTGGNNIDFATGNQLDARNGYGDGFAWNAGTDANALSFNDLHAISNVGIGFDVIKSGPMSFGETYSEGNAGGSYYLGNTLDVYFNRAHCEASGGSASFVISSSTLASGVTSGYFSGCVVSNAGPGGAGNQFNTFRTVGGNYWRVNSSPWTIGNQDPNSADTQLYTWQEGATYGTPNSAGVLALRDDVLNTNLVTYTPSGGWDFIAPLGTPYTTELSFPLTLVNGVANQKVDLYLPASAAFTGEILVSLTDTYGANDNYGSVKKLISAVTSNAGSIYGQVTRYVEASGAIAATYAINDLAWDSGNSRWKITISCSIAAQCNATGLVANVAALSDSTTVIANVATMASSATYTTDSTVYPTPTVSYPGAVIATGGVSVGTPASPIPVIPSTALGFQGPAAGYVQLAPAPSGAGYLYQNGSGTYSWGSPSGTGFNGGAGTSFQDALEIAAPANPASTHDRLYLDSTAHQLKCLTSSGGSCMPSGGGTVTNTVGALTQYSVMIGNGAADSKVSNLTTDSGGNNLTVPGTFNAAGIATGTPPAITTPGTGAADFGTEGTEPASIASGTDGFVADSTSHCEIVWANAVEGGCVVDTTSTQTITGKTVDTATPTEIGYVHNVTSAIQTQLNGKAPSSGIALTALATQTADTFLSNDTAGAASPTAVAMPTTAHTLWLAEGKGSAPSNTAAASTTTYALFATASDPAFRAVAAGDIPATAVPAVAVPTPGTSITLAAPSGFAICTGTCTVSIPVPAAGYQFCILNDDNVSTSITLSALGSSARYENSARTAYGTAGTGTLVVSAAAADMVCIVGRDSTHYLTTNFSGTVTVN